MLTRELLFFIIVENNALHPWRLIAARLRKSVCTVCVCVYVFAAEQLDRQRANLPKTSSQDRSQTIKNTERREIR